MRLNDAVAVLTDSVLNINGGTFSPEKLHRAIQAAGNQFVRESLCSNTTVSVPIGSGVNVVNVQTTIPNFIRDQWYSGWIGYVKVELTTIESIMRALNVVSVPTGQPVLAAFRSDTELFIAPTTDMAYTLTMTYRQPFIPFIAGATSNPLLNIPDEYAYDVIWWGAKFRLLGGAPGHKDAPNAGEKFDQLIATARERFAPNTGSTVDRNTHPSREQKD